MSVYLVGAGPGDPQLLTLQAAALLERADVVIHDRLVETGVLGLVSARAEVIDVGKTPGINAAVAQEAINALLVDRGRRSSCVVRLKGGDPFVFGRGGEEALALERAGVPYAVVPGLSSALALPALAGIPVTHRGLAGAVAVVNGHAPRAHGAGRADLAALARSGATLVILMAAESREELASVLLGAGLEPTTPLMAIEAGSTPHERRLRATLGELARLRVVNPVTIVVGAVAALGLGATPAAPGPRRLALRPGPLLGRRVVVTRERDQAAALVVALERCGASVIRCPTIAITKPSDGGQALVKAAARLSSYAWVVFASANGVERLCAHVRDARCFANARVAAVGAVTASALRTHGLVADLVASRAGAQGLLEVFPPAPPAPAARAVLLPQAEQGGPGLSQGLKALGWEVEVVPAYATQHPEIDPALLDELAGADAITFASPSALQGFLEQAGRGRLPPVVAVIGPTTAAAARDAGIAVVLEAETASVEGLVEALARHFAALRFEHERPS